MRRRGYAKGRGQTERARAELLSEIFSSGLKYVTRSIAPRYPPWGDMGGSPSPAGKDLGRGEVPPGGRDLGWEKSSDTPAVGTSGIGRS